MTVATTSILAKRSLGSKTTKTLRSEVFKFILNKGAYGATLNEIAEATEIRLQTVCARRNELGKMGLVVDGKARRPTSSGRTATVWVIPSRVAAAARKRGLL